MRRVHTCPECALPVRQRDASVTRGGVRQHLACKPTPGRPPRAPGGRQLLTVRVTLDEYQRYVADAAAAGRSLSEHVRASLASARRRTPPPR